MSEVRGAFLWTKIRRRVPSQDLMKGIGPMRRLDGAGVVHGKVVTFEKEYTRVFSAV